MNETIKEIYIHDEYKLQKIGLLDDFVSVVWNNRFLTSGDFEFIVKLTKRNIDLIKRNRFITRKNLDEIGIIEEVTISDDNGTKQIKATGRMAQSLLNRRIVWDSTLLNGLTLPQLRALIDNNLVNPSDVKRQIPAQYTEVLKVGNEIVKDDIYESAKLQSVSADGVIIERQTEKADFYNYVNPQVFQHETNVSVVTENPSASVYIGEMLRNPITNNKDTIELIGGAYKKIKRVAKANVRALLFDFIKNFPERNINDIMYHYDYVRCNILSRANEAIYTDIAIQNIFTHSNFFEYFNVTPANIQGYDPYFFIKLAIEEATVPYGMKDSNGDFHNWCKYDVKDENGNVVLTVSSGYEKPGTEFNNYNAPFSEVATLKAILYCAIGYSVTFHILGLSGSEVHWYHYDFSLSAPIPKGYTIYERTDSTTTIDLSALPTNAEKYSLMNGSELSIGTMSMTMFRKNDVRQYLFLGNSLESNSTIYELVEGSNLADYVEKTLESLNIGIKARYNDTDKNIYLDFYTGENKTLGNGKLRPVIFSKNMDALNGYSITESAKSKTTIVKLKGNADSGTYYRTVGSGAGISRIENFSSISNNTFSGADYAKDLASKGELFLNGFEIVVDAQVYANAYKYREHYKVGDTCTILVDDFAIQYDVRVLEVCESYDTNGYQITLVLGV